MRHLHQFSRAHAPHPSRHASTHIGLWHLKRGRTCPLFDLQRTPETPKSATGSQKVGQDHHQQMHQQEDVAQRMLNTGIGSNCPSGRTFFHGSCFFDLSGIWVPRCAPDNCGHLSWEGAGSAYDLQFPLTRQEDECWSERRQEDVSCTGSDSTCCLQSWWAHDERTQMPSEAIQRVAPLQPSQVAEDAGGWDGFSVSSPAHSEKMSSVPFLNNAGGTAETNSQSPRKQVPLSAENLSCTSSACAFSQSSTLKPESHGALLSSSWNPSCGSPSLSEVAPRFSSHLVEPESSNSPHEAMRIPQHNARAAQASLSSFVQADGPFRAAFGSEVARPDTASSGQVLINSSEPSSGSSDVLSPFWLGDDPVLDLVHNAQFALVGAHIVEEPSKSSATLQESTAEASSSLEDAVHRARESSAAGSSQSPQHAQEELGSPLVASSILIISANNATDIMEVLQPQPSHL